MPRIEFVMVADRAEAVNGKLYVLGGCWDRLTVQSAKHVPVVSVVVSVLLQQEDTGTEHTASIVIGARGKPSRGLAQVEFLAPNPPADGMPGVRVLLSIPNVPVTFPETGIYEVVANVDGAGEARTAFHVTVQPTVESLPAE